MRVIIAAFAAAVAAPGQTSDPPSSIHVERIEARLFYESSGRLSDDLLGHSKPFIGWNTVIGEGDAEEPANDMLVAVRIESDKFGERPEKFVASPVRVMVTDSKGKVLASRSWSHVLTSKTGAVNLPLWVKDVGCAGEITIAAQFNGAMKNRRLNLSCGD